MDLITYFGIVALCYFSTIVGSYIAYETEEELKAGKKYFIYTYFTSYTTLLFFILREIIDNVYFLLIAIIISSAIIISLDKKINSFVLAPIAIYISSLYESMPIVASIVFIMGLLKGTLGSYKFIIRKKKKSMLFIFKKISLQNLIFLIIGIISGFLI